jgi:citrate lyase subunit beta/citryl-CoA lyase
MQVPRSKLFLSAKRLDELDAALAARPDALSFDLEDAVPEAGKAAARHALAERLRAAPLPCAVWVRVNGTHSGHLIDDLLALEGVRLDVVNLPKVEAPWELLLLDGLLRHLERDARCPAPIRIVPTLETPLGLRHAAAIGAASTRVLALQLGGGDLARSTGSEAQGPLNDHFRAALSMAAAEVGVAALDSTPHAMDDPAAFEADARRARSFGFRGKSCMLAWQVAVAHRVFDPLS